MKLQRLLLTQWLSAVYLAIWPGSVRTNLGERVLKVKPTSISLVGKLNEPGSFEGLQIA